MKLQIKMSLAAVVAVVMMGNRCMAQQVEPPFTWEGEGVGSFIRQDGVKDLDLKLEISVDEQGMVEGKVIAGDGTDKIKHIFYTEPKEYGFPGLFSRSIVIVLVVDEYSDNPMLAVWNARVLKDRLLYGEVLLTRYEAGSNTARVLGVGDSEATLMYGDELPSYLMSVLEKCIPYGMARVEGYYREETSASSVETPEDDGAIALFNGKDLDNWHIFLQGGKGDPKSVWKLQDGAIYCTGVPTGCLRTKKQYGDYKLTLEWKWPDTPGNSGVLLHMSAEEKIWPLCVEAQLMHTRAGDFVGMGCSFDENVAREGSPVSYTPRKNDSNEEEPGGWNKYEITCKGDTIEASVNGQLQNKATGVGIRKGYIGLQSEGVPIIFRNIKLTPLE